MNWNILLAFIAAGFSAGLALLATVRSRRPITRWSFSAGMLLFSLEALLAALSFEAASQENAAFWQNLSLLVKMFLPGVWFLFSLTYSRANYREFLGRSRLLLAALFLLPLLWLVTSRFPLLQIVTYKEPLEGWGLHFSQTAKILNGLFLISMILILTNLERTFRAAVGTMRWRIKFLVIGLAIIFGARIYSGTQSLLFSGTVWASLMSRLLPS